VKSSVRPSQRDCGAFGGAVTDLLCQGAVRPASIGVELRPEKKCRADRAMSERIKAALSKR
jgi:hypothetical protein